MNFRNIITFWGGTKMLRKNKITILITVILIIGLGTLTISLTGCSGSSQQIRLGRKYLAANEYDEAIKAFRQAIEDDPQNIPARIGLAQAYSKTIKFYMISDLFEEAVDIAPNSAEVYIGFSQIHIEEGELNTAVDVLQQGYEKTKDKKIKKKLDEIIIGKPVTFEDKAFEAVIRQLIGRKTGDIMTSDLNRIDKLDIIGNQIVKSDVDSLFIIKEDKIYYTLKNKPIEEYGDIRTLKDLKHFKSLKRLRIRLQKDLDISALADFDNISCLRHLVELRIQTSNISNIDDLAAFTSIGCLDLAGNNIEDISTLNLERSTYLDLSYNKISDISPLQNIRMLDYLFLSNNQISDISTLQDLTDLNMLSLSNNQISNINPLQDLTDLQSLELSGNPIKDISILGNLTELEELRLSNIQIADISPLKNLAVLKRLSLDDNQISDISILENLVKLNSLELSNNQISDISPLQNLTGLKHLSLSNNQITDISPLQDSTNLWTLIIDGNNITDHSPLDNLRFTKITK